MHSLTYMLVQCDDKDEAISIVKSYCQEIIQETNFDWFEINDDTLVHVDKSFRAKLAEEKKTLPVLANQFKTEAENALSKGRTTMAGDFYVKCGQILNETFNLNSPFHNVTLWGYDIPPEDENDWYAVEVCFHY